MQVGIDSFAAAFDEHSRAVNPAERLRQLVQQIEHADEVGLDAFGVGEHHRREFLDSAPAVILGAAAARTQRIRLTSAVTVLSAEDPVRAFQNFATVDLLSRGRAELRPLRRDDRPRHRRQFAGVAGRVLEGPARPGGGQPGDRHRHQDDGARQRRRHQSAT